MKEIETNTFRAHHMNELFLEYVRIGYIPDTVAGIKYHNKLIYPIHVTDTTDVVCEKCKSYPLINVCRGPKTRKLDHEAAEILGLEIGQKYSYQELTSIFEKTKHRLGLKNTHYFWEEIIELDKKKST